MLPSQLLPLLGYDDYLGIAREGSVVVPVVRRAVIGKVRVGPRISGHCTVTPRYGGRCRVVPRLSAVGGSPINNEAALFAAAKHALFRDPWSTLADATSFIERFVAIIADNESVPANFLEYLLTEGWEYDIDEAPEGDALDARHLLYWLDRKLKEHKARIGYTDRLSEAGWGEASPDNLADADPLGLVATLESLGCNVAIIDPEAVDDETANSENGPVLITHGSRSCRLLDDSTAKSFGSSADLFKTVTVTRDAYRYRLWGLKTAANGNDTVGGWAQLHEAGGGTVHRFPNSTKPCIVLTRYGSDHQVARELILRKPATHTAPAYIWLGGYPGEFPVVRIGSSVTDGVTVVNGPQIWIGFSSTPRDDLHVRNMWFRGNRDGTYLTGEDEITGRIFCKTLFKVSLSARCSMRYCAITETLPILSTHPDAASFPQYVDIVSTARPTGTPSSSNEAGYSPINVNGAHFTFDRNYVKPADTDIPMDEYDGSGDYPFSRGLDCEDSYCTVSRNTFEGVATGDYVRCTPRIAVPNVVGWHVHHNVIASNGYKCMLASAQVGESVTGVVEYNFIYNSATDGQQTFGGANVDFTGNGIVFRYNVVANNVDGQVQRSGMSAPGGNFRTLADLAGAEFPDDAQANDISHDVYGNIFYNARVTIGTTGAVKYGSAPGEAVNAVHDNIIHGVQIPEKQENTPSDTARFDAPTKVTAPAAVGLGNSSYTNNNVTRDAGDANAAVIFLHESEGPTESTVTLTQYGYDDEFPGVSGTTSLDPQFADPTSGDFTVGNATLAPRVAATPKTREQVGAWRPPGV